MGETKKIEIMTVRICKDFVKSLIQIVYDCFHYSIHYNRNINESIIAITQNNPL